MEELNESLYLAEVKLLTTYCKTCLDGRMKDKIMLFLLKNTLYENAKALGFTGDADRYYDEMLNLLDLKTCNCNINDCKDCKNGCCELCK